jgi:hypothetical protein
MDLKSIVLKRKMKFFNFTPLSNSLSLYWAFLYDVQGIPEPSHLLFCLCSKLHSLLPKNVAPNMSFLRSEIPAEQVLMIALLTSLPIHLYSLMVDIQHAYEYDPCSQLPSKFVHSQHCISVLVNLDICAEHHLLKLYIDISSSILYDNLSYLLNENSCDILTFNKTKIFIETKVTAMKLQGFNL